MWSHRHGRHRTHLRAGMSSPRRPRHPRRRPGPEPPWNGAKVFAPAVDYVRPRERQGRLRLRPSAAHIFLTCTVVSSSTSPTRTLLASSTPTLPTVSLAVFLPHRFRPPWPSRASRELARFCPARRCWFCSCSLAYTPAPGAHTCNLGLLDEQGSPAALAAVRRPSFRPASLNLACQSSVNVSSSLLHVTRILSQTEQ